MNARPLVFCLCLPLLGCHKTEPTAAGAKDAPAEKKTAELENSGLKLSKEAQDLSGIKVAAVENASLAPALHAFGRVLDPGLLIQEVSDLATARAASDASNRDLERTRKLNTMGENASARAVEAAEAIARRDALAADLAAQKIIAAWGNSLAGRDDLSAFVGRLVHQEAALVRLDLPSGQVLTQAPAEFSVSSPANPKMTWSARFLSFAASADPQTQSQGVLAVIEADPPPIGLALVARVPVPGEPRVGVRVPRAALVRYGDGVFVYVRKGDDAFERHAITNAGDVDGDVFASEGVSVGDLIVVAGAQQLLSEEMKGSSPAAD